MSFASIATIAYAAILIAGGIVGWRVSGSRISLTMSLASAALLAVAYRISLTSPAGGSLMGAIVALALTVVFALRLRKTGKFMPAGMMLALSAIVALLLGVSAFRS